MKRIWVKYILLLWALVTISNQTYGQKTLISCEKSVFHLGDIEENAGKVSHVFEVRNEGSSPMVITNVTASCGCTTPEWTKHPVPAGKIGTIKVTYDPTNRPGKFMKTIRVYAQGMNNGLILTIRGNVIKGESKDIE